MAQAAAPALQTNTGGVTKNKLISIGRPNGPDLQLKNIATELAFQNTTPATANIIQADSSITEVLNVVSFLTSTDRSFAGLVDAANSAYDGTADEGSIDAATGYYVEPAAAAGDFEPAMINLNTFEHTDIQSATVKIPVSILKRRGAAAVTGDAPDSFVDMTKIVITRASADKESKALLSDCIKQMINLLIQTRQIFGPKGWTDLFQKVKGGGGSSKKAKRTHRRHRRRYSSKQY
jgi:hypothetical protein